MARWIGGGRRQWRGWRRGHREFCAARLAGRCEITSMVTAPMVTAPMDTNCGCSVLVADSPEHSDTHVDDHLGRRTSTPLRRRVPRYSETKSLLSGPQPSAGSSRAHPAEGADSDTRAPCPAGHQPLHRPIVTQPMAMEGSSIAESTCRHKPGRLHLAAITAAAVSGEAASVTTDDRGLHVSCDLTMVHGRAPSASGPVPQLKASPLLNVEYT